MAANFYDLTKALGRWDNEGGAIGSPPVPDTALTVDEVRVLKCLGAAVIMQWNNLSADIQGDIFADAATMHDPVRQFQLKQQIAHFLHEHKKSV